MQEIRGLIIHHRRVAAVAVKERRREVGLKMRLGSSLLHMFWSRFSLALVSGYGSCSEYCLVREAIVFTDGRPLGCEIARTSYLLLV